MPGAAPLRVTFFLCRSGSNTAEKIEIVARPGKHVWASCVCLSCDGSGLKHFRKLLRNLRKPLLHRVSDVSSECGGPISPLVRAGVITTMIFTSRAAARSYTTVSCAWGSWEDGCPLNHFVFLVKVLKIVLLGDLGKTTVIGHFRLYSGGHTFLLPQFFAIFTPSFLYFVIVGKKRGW